MPFPFPELHDTFNTANRSNPIFGILKSDLVFGFFFVSTVQLSGKIDQGILCPWESGKQFLSLPESEVLSRIMKNNIEEETAKALYISFWKIFVDARTKERNAKVKAKVRRRPFKRVENM